jgi:hypothetical protein
VEDFLGILMFILFIGASLVGRMKKVQGPRPPFNPSAGPPAVEAEESDSHADPWQMPTRPEPAIVTVDAPAPAKVVAKRPSRQHNARDMIEPRFTEFRSSFQVDQPVQLEDVSGEGAGGMAFGYAQNLAQAVVMNEILGKPKALRNRGARI